MPEALALGFDCSAAHCAAALLSGDRVLAVRAETMGKGQAERLMPMLEEVLAEAGVAWCDLAVIGVGCGPGSFTGTRIAVAAARGLALGLGVPAVGVGLSEVISGDSEAAPAGPAIVAAAGLAFGPGAATLGEAAVAQAATLARSEATTPSAAEAADPAAIAVAVARIALARRDAPGPRPAPLYDRPADAAPARDRGPAIIPG